MTWPSLDLSLSGFLGLMLVGALHFSSWIALDHIGMVFVGSVRIHLERYGCPSVNVDSMRQ